MRREGGWFPSRQGGMAFHAIGRDLCSNMIGVAGGVKISLMAGEAFGRNIRIVIAGMTFITIKNRMTIGEGKKEMIKTGSSPCKSIHGVAFNTVGGNVTLDMVWIACRSIIFPVTINAFNPQRFKTKKGSGWMAFHTFSQQVGTEKWETALPVNISQIIYDP